MYKLLKFFLLNAVVFLSACYDEESTYGKEWVTSAFRNVTIDTSTVVTTAVLIDSLETSGKNLVLVGRYTHPCWGSITATSYLPYSRPSYTTDSEEKVALDSLVFRLAYTGRFIGDTTQVQSFSIHRLTEKISLTDAGYLYNHSSFSYETEPLTSYRFRPKPSSPDTLDIRLPDALGEDLLTRFHSGDEAVSSDRFEEYFKGLVLVPDAGNSHSVLTFAVTDSLASMILYYHIENEWNEQRQLLFSPSATSQFNSITHDRSGTAMEEYPTRDVEIPSGALDNRSLLFGGLGWYTRLEFPYLNDLLQQGKQVQVESALLKIYPEPGTYSASNALPDSIYLYIADENNVVTEAVTDYLGEEVQAGVLVKDETFQENTYYYFDVTQFMSEELGAFGMYKHNLQLVLHEGDYTSTLRNLTFSDQGGRSPIVLQLIYKIYESY